MEHIDLKKLIKRKDCYGFIIRCKNKYFYQNTNDLGFYFETMNETNNQQQTIIKKVKIDKNAYVYVLRNRYHIPSSEAFLTFKQALIAIKDCYNKKLTEKEQKIANKIWSTIL